MKQMALEPVLRNIVEAGELSRLAARVQFCAMGEIIIDEQKCLRDYAAKAERDCPLREWDVWWSMYRVYRLLNRAWNVRNLSIGEVSRIEERDVSRLEKFPTDPCFRDLWPDMRRFRGSPRIPSQNRRGVLDADKMVIWLATAATARDILRYRLELTLHGARESAKFRPNKRIFVIDDKPITEMELGFRLSSIYWYMNTAWSSRRGYNNPRTGGGLTKRALSHRGMFPRAFLAAKSTP